MALSKELIDSDLGLVLHALGKPVKNAGKWQEELGNTAPSEAEILAKHAEIVAQREVLKASSGGSVYDTGLGYSLETAVEDQNAFTRLIVGMDIVGAPDDTVVDIKDTEGNFQQITLGQLKDILKGYVPFCFQLWKDIYGR